MRPIRDLTGMDFGRLAVIGRAETKQPGNGSLRWVCFCECGTKIEVVSYSLLTGRSTSCGCYRKERVSLSRYVHGQSHSALYPLWIDITGKCYISRHPSYNSFGGKGIDVWGPWRNPAKFTADIQNIVGFDKRILTVGSFNVGKTLIRIDETGDFEPTNVKWSVPVSQTL